jgi:hypothetical protein
MPAGTDGKGREAPPDRPPPAGKPNACPPGGGRARLILKAFGLVGQLGLTVVAGGFLGALAGHGVDRWLGTAPGFLIGGMLFGLAGGAVGAYRLIVRYLGE